MGPCSCTRDQPLTPFFYFSVFLFGSKTQEAMQPHVKTSFNLQNSLLHNALGYYYPARFSEEVHDFCTAFGTKRAAK